MRTVCTPVHETMHSVNDVIGHLGSTKHTKPVLPTPRPNCGIGFIFDPGAVKQCKLFGLTGNWAT